MLKSCGMILVLVAAFSFFACGIEDFPFIGPVPQDNVTPVMNNRATVRIPNNYDGSPFSHFDIYYRIYVSDTPQASTESGTFSAINPALASDHNVFNPYIDSTTQVNVNMETLFRGRGYYLLALQDDQALGSVLSSSVWGTELVFDFSSGRAPTMTAGGTSYILWRSISPGVGGLRNDPQPDRLFRNRIELSETITPEINADVVNKADIAPSIRRYTYAAMYITAVGINVTAYSYIYSTPALIHVFLIPD